MRSVVASALVVSVSLMGCFPHSARNRVIAEITEGALVAGGVALEAGTTTQADCQAQTGGMNCSSSSGVAGGLGLGMILVGLVGFIATISSSDDKPPPPAIDIKATPAPLEPVAAPATPVPTPVPVPVGSGA
jgi:hypothetical protein